MSAPMHGAWVSHRLGGTANDANNANAGCSDIASSLAPWRCTRVLRFCCPHCWLISPIPTPRDQREPGFGLVAAVGRIGELMVTVNVALRRVRAPGVDGGVAKARIAGTGWQPTASISNIRLDLYQKRLRSRRPCETGEPAIGSGRMVSGSATTTFRSFSGRSFASGEPGCDAARWFSTASSIGIQRSGAMRGGES